MVVGDNQTATVNNDPRTHAVDFLAGRNPACRRVGNGFVPLDVDDCRSVLRMASTMGVIRGLSSARRYDEFAATTIAAPMTEA